MANVIDSATAWGLPNCTDNSVHENSGDSGLDKREAMHNRCLVIDVAHQTQRISQASVERRAQCGPCWGPFEGTCANGRRPSLDVVKNLRRCCGSIRGMLVGLPEWCDGPSGGMLLAPPHDLQAVRGRDCDLVRAVWVPRSHPRSGIV